MTRTVKIDTFVRTVEAMLEANEAREKRHAKEYGDLDASHDGALNCLVAMVKVPAIRSAITPELRAMLAKYVDPDEYQDWT